MYRTNWTVDQMPQYHFKGKSLVQGEGAAGPSGPILHISFTSFWEFHHVPNFQLAKQDQADSETAKEKCAKAVPPLSLYSVNGTFGSEPERGVADVGSKVDLSGIPLADALAQLVERRVQEGADVRLSQLQ